MIKLPFTFFAMLFTSFTFAESRGFDLELGPYLSSMDYSEKKDISQTGGLSGIKGKFSAYYPFSVTLIDLTYASGDADYKGAGKISNIKSEVYDLKAMIGRAFYLNGMYRFTPFLGLGYRRATMNSSGRVSTSSVRGYKSQQTYFYNPIGFEIQELIGDTSWVVGGRFEYDNLLISKNETRLGAADSYKAVMVGQSKGRGYNFYLSFRQFLNPDGSGIVIEPFYKHWKASGSDNKSAPSYTADHSSNEWGAALMVSF
ncbi:hypothetical protein EBI01_11625 [Marinomonas rhizomae]|uniref:Outer membrane protein with beta-barrel domain n=1 Tax=Marinomonas rhizomae TaxID=491948 RepID=A0A366J8C1_9GAMM|nr:hypothetical protein [Marinomonas rhizomae]RBP83203.1 hypothetical protein DFP80_107182 [Marinomonas rhizomae]RNF72500.1 hypothetical protein EBI01_11625 [Marinomonas rhizomae]